MNTLDTRDLAEKRDELKESIFNSFIENFPQYEEQTSSFDDILLDEEEIESWKEDFEDELKEIEEIDTIENAIGSEFGYGEQLIDVDDFTEYTEELCTDLGYISKDFPSWIEIDWEATAKNVESDYTEFTYQGTQYLVRS